MASVWTTMSAGTLSSDSLTGAGGSASVAACSQCLLPRSYRSPPVISAVSYWLHRSVLLSEGGDEACEMGVTGDHLGGWLRHWL